MNNIFTMQKIESKYYFWAKHFILGFLAFVALSCDKYDAFEEEPVSEEVIMLRDSLVGTWHYYQESENGNGEIFSEDITYFLFSDSSAIYDFKFINGSSSYTGEMHNSNWVIWEDGAYYLQIGEPEFYDPEGIFEIIGFYGDSLLIEQWSSDQWDEDKSGPRMYLRQ